MGKQLDILRSLAILALLLAIGSSPALAAAGYSSERRVIDDNWVLSLGAYLAEFKTNAGVGAGDVLGSTINAEEILGLDTDQTVVRLNGMHRFNERHAIGLGLWSINRDGYAAIEEQVEFEGYIFDIGAELKTAFDSDWMRVDWRYSLLRTDRGEAGFAIGLSSYQFDISIEGRATISDGMGGIVYEEVRAAGDILAPVPTVGMFMNYAFRPNLVMKVHADFFDLDISDIEGKLVDSGIEAEWYFSRHVGCGLGLNITDIDYRDTGDDSFEVDFRQSGLLGYLTFAF